MTGTETTGPDQAGSQPAGPEGSGLHPVSSEMLEIGGLRFDVSFRAPAGATLRVEGKVGADWQELLRFDDFVDAPHYHVPADAGATMFDRAAHGDPMEWYITQVRDHLPEWLTDAGFAEVLPSVDLDAVSANASRVREAMVTCVPDGFTRVPGIGLQRVGAEPTADG